jgi:hypothetical protein
MRKEVILCTEVYSGLSESKQHNVEKNLEPLSSSYLFFIE